MEAKDIIEGNKRNMALQIADQLQKSIHEEISETLNLSQKPNLSYQDCMNTCLIFRLALLQEQIAAKERDIVDFAEWYHKYKILAGGFDSRKSGELYGLYLELIKNQKQ